MSSAKTRRSDPRAVGLTDEPHHEPSRQSAPDQPTSREHAGASSRPPTANATAPGATKKRRPGRPTLLTPEMHDKICYYPALGFKGSQLAAIVGVSPSTLAEWLATGEDPARCVPPEASSPHCRMLVRELVDGIERAIADRLIAPQEMLTAKRRLPQDKVHAHPKAGGHGPRSPRNAKGQPEWVQDSVRKSPKIPVSVPPQPSTSSSCTKRGPRNPGTTGRRSTGPNPPTSNGVLPRQSRK